MKHDSKENRSPVIATGPVPDKAVRLAPMGRKSSLARFKDNLRKNYWLYIFLIPTIIWFLIFCYGPMGGIVIAFKRYNGVQSIWESRWVGLKWFESFFASHYASTTIKNTLLLSLYYLVTFPIPIIVALIINEVHNKRFKTVAQTVMYAPHFISTVVLVSMLNLFFAPNYGFFNTIITALGGESRNFMSENSAFRHLYVWSGVWQNFGWDCIIYVAALSSVDPSLHEAATLDGASRFQRIWHINLPAIKPTIAIMFIMQVGHLMADNTDKVLLMKNDLNSATAEVIGTFVYSRGLVSGDFSYATAVGLFVNVVNFILLLTVNKISNKLTDTSLF